MNTFDFLPVSKADMEERGWWYYDFLVVTADAYIDHPSFGSAIIARVLEDEGFRVAVLAQPDWHSADAFRAMGKPRYGVMIGGGNIDSMVAHYTAAKKRRSADAYSPGNKMGLRPDRPSTPTGHGRPSPGSPSSSAAWRAASAASPTTTTGTTRSAAPSSLMPRRICWRAGHPADRPPPQPWGGCVHPDGHPGHRLRRKAGGLRLPRRHRPLL